MKYYILAMLLAVGLGACALDLEIEHADGTTIDLEIGDDDAEEGTD